VAKTNVNARRRLGKIDGQKLTQDVRRMLGKMVWQKPTQKVRRRLGKLVMQANAKTYSAGGGRRQIKSYRRRKAAS
jgi:hypothetical protein